MRIGKKMLSLARQRLTQIREDYALKKAINKVIDTRTYYGFTVHPHVRLFERAISKILDARPVLGVNSGNCLSYQTSDFQVKCHITQKIRCIKSSSRGG